MATKSDQKPTTAEVTMESSTIFPRSPTFSFLFMAAFLICLGWLTVKSDRGVPKPEFSEFQSPPTIGQQIDRTSMIEIGKPQQVKRINWCQCIGSRAATDLHLIRERLAPLEERCFDHKPEIIVIDLYFIRLPPAGGIAPSVFVRPNDIDDKKGVLPMQYIPPSMMRIGVMNHTDSSWVPIDIRHLQLPRR